MAATHVTTEEPEAEMLPLAEVVGLRAEAIVGRRKVPRTAYRWSSA